MTTQACNRDGFYFWDGSGKDINERCDTCGHVLAVHGDDYLCDLCVLVFAISTAIVKADTQ
jgi:ribosomal protein S27AE